MEQITKILEIIVLAVVQGIGEFLPISSSGHLIAVNDLFVRLGAEPLEDTLFLSILLHLGSLLAILVVFWKRILSLLFSDRRLIPLLFLGTIPAVLVGFTVQKYAKPLLESPLLTACCFIGTAFLLLASSRIKPGPILARELSYKKALLIGLFQAIAILPGFSRSGFTIVGALLYKLRREEAATFSFLLAIPVIGGGSLLEIVKLFKHANEQQREPVLFLVIGVLLSFIIGIFALIWLLKWLQHGKLYWFAFWLFLIGPALLAVSLCCPLKKTTDLNPESSVSRQNSVEPVENETGLNKGEPIEKVDVFESESLRQNNRAIAESLLGPNDVDIQQELVINDLADWESEPFGENNRSEKPFPRPLVTIPNEELILLDPQSPLWVSPDRTQVILVGEVCLQEGVLEFFACSRHSKEHESIVALDVQPHLIHAALLLIGVEPGEPARFTPEFTPPTGPEIRILVRWNNEGGNWEECLAQQLILENTPELYYNDQRSVSMEPTSPREMSVPFVFTGSFFREYEDEKGDSRQLYMADATGELFGVSNFPSSILDVPIQSSDSNDSLLFCANSARIPPIGTEVTLILDRR
ncbi:MAG: undecaprenyl-diphosphate phosphatase [Thermoguttaceae bacterium]